MKRTILAALTAASVLTGPALAADSVKVGISGGDSEIIWEKVKEVAAQDDLDVELVVFSDYLLPNEALARGISTPTPSSTSLSSTTRSRRKAMT